MGQRLQPPAQAGLAIELQPGAVGQRLLVFPRRLRRFGQTCRITVAQDYTPVLASLSRIRWLAAGGGAAALLLVLLLQWLTVRRALRGRWSGCAGRSPSYRPGN